MPFIPHLFIILLSATMKDIENNLAEEETHILDQGKLCKATFNKLFYADDTLIMDYYYYYYCYRSRWTYFTKQIQR